MFLKLDHTPKLQVKLNTNSLNSLKIGFEMSLTSSSSENVFFNEYNEKPVKYRITYTLAEFNNSITYDVLSK